MDLTPRDAHLKLMTVTGNGHVEPQPSQVCELCNRRRPADFGGCKREGCPWPITS